MHVICVDKSISLRCQPLSVVAVKFSSNENLEFFLSMGFHFLRGYPPRQPAPLVNSGASVRTSEGRYTRDYTSSVKPTYILLRRPCKPIGANSSHALDLKYDKVIINIRPHIHVYIFHIYNIIIIIIIKTLFHR